MNQTCFECLVSLFPGGGEEKTFLVHRLVYQAFVKDIDFDSDGLMVMHKNGDGRNNHFNNLMTGSKNEVFKNAYRRKRHISPFALKTSEEIKEISQRASLTRQKKIIRYSLQGKQLKIFNSIKEAPEKTGIADSNLVRVLEGDTLTAGSIFKNKYSCLQHNQLHCRPE